MKTAVALLLLLFLVTVAIAQTSAPQWFVGPVVVNPGANAVLVTSAPLSAGQWLVAAYIASDVGAPAFLQRVDSAGGIHESLFIPGSTSFIMFQGPMKLVLSANDRMRVISRNSITGEAQASIFLQQ